MLYFFVLFFPTVRLDLRSWTSTAEEFPSNHFKTTRPDTFFEFHFPEPTILTTACV